MFRHLRWTALLAVVALVLAACNGGETSTPAASEPAASAAESAGESMGDDPTAVCAADEFGCVEIGEGEDITLGTALVITTADADLGQDSQYGAVVAGNVRFTSAA